MAHTHIEKAELLNSFFASCFNQSHSPLDIADSHVIPQAGEPCSSILCDEGLVCDLLASLKGALKRKSNAPLTFLNS